MPSTTAGVAWTEHDNYYGEQFALVYRDPDASGASPSVLQNRYLYGPQVDQILADEQFVDGVFDQVLWPLADHLGTIRDLALYDDPTDSTSIANHRRYDSFGNLVNESHEAIDHLFGFTGREYDFETGLAYYRARYYDPSVGRFLSEDPLGFAAGDTNLSRYVSNSPLDSTDPNGKHRVYINGSDLYFQQESPGLVCEYGCRFANSLGPGDRKRVRGLWPRGRVRGTLGQRSLPT